MERKLWATAQSLDTGRSISNGRRQSPYNLWTRHLGPQDWPDSIFDMTDEEGKLIPTHNIVLRVQDQCQDWHEFTRSLNIRSFRPQKFVAGQPEFPMFNPSIPVQDVLYNGQSLVSGNVSSAQIKVSATQQGIIGR